MVPTNVLGGEVTQRLTLTKRVGNGRLSLVFAAVHQVLARRFAVKILRPWLTRDQTAQKRLRQMLREASVISHPNFVSLYDYGQLVDGRIYVTTDYVRGIQLSRVLERDHRFSVNRAVPVVAQLAAAIAAAHAQHVVHGDVKPSNIMLVDQSDSHEAAYIYDPMIVPALAGSHRDRDALGFIRYYGSVDYLSPELLAGEQVDARSDIYALGAVLYRLVTGEPPFVGDAEEIVSAHRRRDVIPMSRRYGGEAISASLDEIVLRCLEKKPSDRFRSMQELYVALCALSPLRPTGVAEPMVAPLTVADSDSYTEELLPESPSRLRRLLYDTMLDLATHLQQQNWASDEMMAAANELTSLRDDLNSAVSTAEQIENRFEDVRRQMRDSEAAIRYAMIDLNLVKNDHIAANSPGLSEIDFQMAELQASLEKLQTQRVQRFALLNEELHGARERIRGNESDLALHARRLYGELDEVQQGVSTPVARRLYNRMERCRTALARLLPL